MKLIIQNDRIIATALDSYVAQGFEQGVVDAPVDYDETKREHYKFVEDQLVYDIQEAVVMLAQQRLDTFAQTRNYDDIKSACDYAGCSVAKFSVEGQYCKDKRAETWAKLYEILAEVEAGTRPKPTSFADIESELPALAWPQ